MSTTGILHSRSVTKFDNGLKIFIPVYMFMQPDAVAFSSAHFGAGVGAIFLDSVDCRGSEGELLACARSWAVNCYRGHNEDAGVRCQGRFICVAG